MSCVKGKIALRHERFDWAVVNTQPHKEGVAVDNLVRQGFSAYCPLVRKRVRHARKTHDVLRPLFPGYLFVEVPKDRRAWRPIVSTYGVRALLRHGDEPCRLDPRFIAALQAREIDGIIVAPASPYEVGQQVRITDGPFEGLVATITDMNEKDRLVVLMDLLNRPVRVRLYGRQVAAN